MIYTSYYANLKNIPENLTPISISLYKPKGIFIDSIPELAPSKDILNKYKNSKQTNLDKDNYVKAYKDQIKNFDFSKLNNVVLMCYEHPNDFCHRHIVSEMIDIQLNMDVKELGYENSKKQDYSILEDKKHIAVIGSRSFNNYALMEYILNEYVSKDTIIVSGGANGADKLSEIYAKKYKIKTKIYYPDWEKGKHAGFLRNKQIIDAADEVIAFTNGSAGTANSIELANKQNKKVLIIPFKENYSPTISFEKRFNMKLCNENPNSIYVFGDNLLKKGKGGQAVIRDCENAFGIPTKRLPSMNSESFFSDKDEELEAVKSSLRDLYKLLLSGKHIVFPIDGLGTGLADMQNKSPKVFNAMNDIIKQYFLGLKS